MDQIKWPNGLAEIKEYFGDPRPYIREHGASVDPAWPEQILVPIVLPAPLPLSWDPSVSVSRIRCHFLVAEPLTQVYRDIHERGLWMELHDFGGCYCWRMTRGGTKLSTHGWGIAVDHDVARNQLGATPQMHPGIVSIFEEHGATWGGRWARPDGMHFAFCSGY